MKWIGLGVLLALCFAPQLARGVTLAEGLEQTLVLAGREDPTAVRFAASGHVFVAEKSGRVWGYESLEDSIPTLVVDLRASVHNFWDRGLLGLAVHPNFPATPHLYVLYTHDTWPPGDPRFGDPSQPRWGTGTPNPSSTDPCPNANPPTPEAPGATREGCVVYGRLSRLALQPQTLAGAEQVALQGGWCQQFPSHSMGDLLFGADGYLYVSAGEGAHFNHADYGFDGIPTNPCDDPPDGIGGANTDPDAEGGALRAQDLLTPGDPSAWSGSILRLDVSTLPPGAPPSNPLVGNAVADDDFVVAMGLRNPFRIARRPATSEIWIADAGWRIWEEINRLADPLGTIENFGWPCYDGGAGGLEVNQEGYLNQILCRRLYGEITDPPLPANIVATAAYFAYAHSEQVVPGELCGTGTSVIAGLAFNDGERYPPDYEQALFFADASRRCIWFAPAGPDGTPDFAERAPLVSQAPGRVVDLQLGPDGLLYYVDFDGGGVYQITSPVSAPVLHPQARVALLLALAGLVLLLIGRGGRRRAS